jgi:L-asparaginase
MKLALIATGGTFDKEYNELDGELYFKETHIPEMLTLGRSHVPVRIQILMMKDSLRMTGADRQAPTGRRSRRPAARRASVASW